MITQASIITKNNKPLIRWGNNTIYKMRQIGQESYSMLPGREINFSKNDLQSNKHILIYSERSGGTSDFLEWVCDRLNEMGEEWLLINGEKWDWDFCQKSAKTDQIDKTAADLKTLIEKFGRENIHLFNWVKNLSAPFTFIIRNLLFLGEEISLQIATAIRVVAETARNPFFKVLIASTSESVFLDFPYRSGLISLTNQYRILPFSVNEIKLLACEGVDPPLHFSETDNALECFYGHTGGQRLLVNHMLRRLRELTSPLETTRLVSVELVERAAREMRMLSPSQVKSWQEQLRAILKAEPELIQPMQAYVTGRTLGPARFPPPAKERFLFIAGWIGLNKVGRWGISSTFHAHLARPVLDQFKYGDS